MQYFLVFFVFQVPNSAIKECSNYTDFDGKLFRDPVKKEQDINTYLPKLVTAK